MNIRKGHDCRVWCLEHKACQDSRIGNMGSLPSSSENPFDSPPSCELAAISCLHAEDGGKSEERIDHVIGARKLTLGAEDDPHPYPSCDVPLAWSWAPDARPGFMGSKLSARSEMVMAHARNGSVATKQSVSWQTALRRFP